jgi:hypothetical protein
MRNLRKIIFIIGVGRSGTTLLMTMLNAHSEICFPPETTFLHRYICNPKIHRIIEKKNQSFFHSLLNKDTNFKRIGMKPEHIISNLSFNMDLKKIYLNMLNKYAASKNKSIIGDKYPRNLELLPEMKFLFPDAYIIHIIRDPRDVIASRLKTWWGQRRNFISHVGITREMLKLASEQGRKLYGERYHELRYEDLLSDPEKELIEVCKKIGVSYEKKMLNFQESASQIVQKEELAHKRNNLKPLIRNNIEKWKKDLSLLKVVLIEAGCRRNMKTYRYEKKYEIFSLFFLLFNFIYIIFGQFFRIYQKFRFIRLSKCSTYKNDKKL